MRKIQLLFALFLITFFTACNPDDSPSGSSQNDDTFAENFGSTTSRDFIGQIVNTDNQPVQNATITIGTSTVQTDVNGVFIINGASVHTKFAYIKATKAGYLDGSRAMVPTSGKNNVKIMLIHNTPLQSVQSGIASEVSLPSGTKVKFDGAFQDEDGNAYSGSVQVSMFHLTSSDANLNSLMPGMLYAQTQNNQEAVLETFGMLNVELRGSSGQKLNIKEGHTAEITMKIDDSQLATAPSSIPLWHFDEQKGYWKEDGVATKSGNKYIGDVSHFSWWNCDIANSTINLSFTFVDANGQPLPFAEIWIISDSSGHVTATTDENGQISGLLPANETFTINVHSINTCGVVFTTSIGPFTADTIVPDIVVNDTPTILNTKIFGKLLKCNNSPVTNGYLLLRQNNRSKVCPVDNGDFSIDQFYCNNSPTFSLIGFDFDNLQQTGIIQYDFKKPTTFVGNLIACNSITEFVSFQVDNGPVVFYTSNFYNGFELFHPTTMPYGISLRDYIQSIPNFSLWVREQLPGFYHDVMLTANSGPSGYINSESNGISFDLTIAKAGAIGEYIDMTFDGTYYGANNAVRRLRGTVHVIRQY